MSLSGTAMTRSSYVSRRMFAVVVALVVLMVGASDLVVWRLARGPTGAQVQAQVDREIAHRSQIRDGQFCALLAAVPRTPVTEAVRLRLGCFAATPRPTPTQVAPSTPNSKPTLVLVGPSPHPTATVTQKPKPRVTVTEHPTRPPTHKPTPRPSKSCRLNLLGLCALK